MSVFSIKYWIKKGLSEEEAKYQIAIRRPNNVFYYINKGFTEEEAKIKVSERQAKGGEKRKLLSIEDKRKLTPRCIEFWLSKGLSEQSAKKALANHQKTFSKELCIKKYGDIEGLRIWQKRQDDWQTTLANKSIEETEDINSRKNRWKNLSNDESTALKERIVTTLLDTLSRRTVEESRRIGEKIRNGQVLSGRAMSADQIDQFALYKSKVWAETKRNDLSLLENVDKRGRASFHLDHKYSIWQGFIDGTCPTIVGHIKNLEMLPFQENLSKFNKCSHSLLELLELISKNTDA
jgi:hypothetical protein